MGSILQKIYDKLLFEKKISSQVDLANKLGYKSEGYISTLINTDVEVPHKMQKKLMEIFNIEKDLFSTTTTDGTDPEFQVKQGQDKEVVMIGRQPYRRLKPDEYNEAFKGWPGVPMYNVPVTASFVQTYRDESVFHPQYYLHDPRFKDCNFGAIITGDSMYSEIRHGDFVVCQEIIDKDFIVYGDIYYVVSSNGLETCKYINADPKNDDNLLLVPRNESISPSPIPKRMVERLYKVRGVVRGY